MPRMESGNDLLTSPEVSRQLGVSIRTVHRRVEAGELTAAQKLPGPNGAYLFRRADVEQYLAQLPRPASSSVETPVSAGSRGAA